MTLLKTRGTYFLALVLSMLTGLHAVQAETSKKDMQIASRAVSFMADAPTGSVSAAVVYDPASAASKADADAIMAIIGGGLKAGKATLTGRLVAANALGDLADAKVAFIASDASSQHAAIFAEAAARSILVISTDMNCVDTDNCVVGVASKPKVSIVVSKAASSAAGLSFKPAFLMMVKEK